MKNIEEENANISEESEDSNDQEINVESSINSFENNSSDSETDDEVDDETNGDAKELFFNLLSITNFKIHNIIRSDLFYFVGRIVFKIRKLINRINNSNNVYMHFERKKMEAKINENLIIDFQVRWNTTFDMLKRVLALKSVVNDITMNAESIPNLAVSKLKCLKKKFLSLK